jgi:HEAT repeat protein
MSLLLLIFWCAAGAVAVTVILTIFVRFLTAIRRWRLGRYQRVVRDHLTAYVVGARDDPPPAPSGRFEQRVLRRDLVALVPSVKGEARARVTEVFSESGMVEVAHQDLEARDSLTRIRAADALGTLHVAEAKPWLLERLHHNDGLMRMACARALAELGAVDALPEIMAALAEVDAEPGDVEEVLLTFSSSAVPFLTEMLVEGSPSERILAAGALGHIGSIEVLPELCNAVGEPDDELAASAARALGQLGDARATPLLIELLGGDRSWFVRVAAALALGLLEDPAATTALVEQLDADEWDLRNAAARALVALGPAGLNAVIAAVDTISKRGLAHYAGLLDVAGRMESIILRAADGDAGCDRFVRAVSAAGVRARLEDLAASSLQPDHYASELLAELEMAR